MKQFTSLFCAILAATAAQAVELPVVTDVTLSQDSSTRVVTVNYTLSGTNAIITFDALTNGVSIGGENIHYVVGDVNKLVQPGQRALYWQARRSWPDQKVQNAFQARVTAWSESSPPDYMVVDLARPGTVNWYESAGTLPNGGLTNDIYRTEKLVLRRIHASGESYWMGSGGTDANATPHEVSLTKDFYIGVFEYTCGQRRLIRPANARDITDEVATLPAGAINRDYVVGTEAGMRTVQADVDQYVWPDHGHAVSPDSQLGLLRTLAGGKFAFDLPTEAQWEFAARAGTTTKMYNGDGGVDAVAWYSGNAGGVRHRVGEKEPNAWGLYDMYGNVVEVVLDWYTADITSFTLDPAGPTQANSTGKVVARGGSWAWDEQETCSTYRDYQNPNGEYGSARGARICWTIE